MALPHDLIEVKGNQDMKSMNRQTINMSSTRRRPEEGDICIIGGNHVGHNIANRLATRGTSITHIDPIPPSDPPPDLTVHEVVSLDATALVDADLSEKTTVLVVQPKDRTNLLMAQLARTQYDVSRVIARVNDPRRVVAFDDIGIETVDASAALGRVISERL